MKVVRRDPNKGYIDTVLWVPKNAVNVEGMKNALTFTTQDRTDVRIFTIYRETKDHLLVPREFLSPANCEFQIIDCRPVAFPVADIQSRIKLDHFKANDGSLQPTGKTLQREALQALLDTRGGILQLACGKGKTAVFLELTTRLKTPALIVVDNTQLMEQWKKEIEDKLIVPGGVGLIQGDKFDWQKSVVLTTYQTLSARADVMPEDARRWFGVIGWDEGHHVGAPVFAKTADLFLGRRYALTATPTRDDGQHVIYQHHIGPVIYKDLRQELTPSIYFYWSGFSLDKESPIVRAATEDRNKELHIGKIAGYLGQWKERLELILKLVNEARAEGRKVLVLSKSVDELVNLFALWQNKDLFTNIKIPTPADVGETVLPRELGEVQLKRMNRDRHALYEALKLAKDPIKVQNIKGRLAGIDQALQQHMCWKKIDAILSKEQKKYIKELTGGVTNAGLMIHAVSVAVRSKLMSTKDVVFAVAKYGREGLDSPDLDTVIACEPMSSRNTLQQFLGRVLRKKEGKFRPVVVFIEDEIGPFMGMCNSIRRFLREWPVDEGGPYNYTNVGHPTSYRRKGSTWERPTMSFGR